MKLIIETTAITAGQLRRARDSYAKHNPEWMKNSTWNFEVSLKYAIASAIEDLTHVTLRPDEIEIFTEKKQEREK